MDYLEWQVRLATDFFGTKQDRAYALYWEGRASFSRDPIASSLISAPGYPPMFLPARWTNRERAGRMMTPSEVVFEFVTDLPGDAFDRIERFRDSGRLYARIEGQLAVVRKEGYRASTQPFHDLAAVMWGDRVPAADIRTEPFELTRDTWCQQILAVIRPPGRYVVEVATPTGSPVDETAKRALDHLAAAQRAFSEGHYSEVARVCYRALDELNQFGQKVDERYGKFGRDRILEQVKTIKSLCNPERHGSQPHHDGLEVDRILAQHVLATTSSLAGVVLR
ncbi:hypothetical protein WMF20_11850 [Sorangium sp. So ce834]|uniref:hypothetical protein n=1 Tax=Sorangium sp. So ce834 TaxID=3133321 RepID=UPI003F607D66